jgi:hypothetical protein
MGAGGTQQVHDFNPAEENGLFWTVPVPEDAAEADLEDGNATFELTNFTIDDYGNAGNALGGGKEIATANLTLRIRWRGLKSRLHASQPGLPTPFDARELQAFNSGATMHWSAVENGHAFAGKTNTADFAMLARERNGVFFESGDDD